MSDSFLLSGGSVMPGEFHNYRIGGTLCNSFAIGDIGSGDDFFLIGAQPEDDSPYCLLTGNVLDSEGNLLFTLVRNVLTFNPFHCSRIHGDGIGYEIHDGLGNLVLKASTVFEHDTQSYLTTIEGNFYGNDRELRAQASGDGQHDQFSAACKSAFGFNGSSFGISSYSDDEERRAKLALSMRGHLHRILTGNHVDTTIELDGSLVVDATFERCKLILRDGNFGFDGDCRMTGCRIDVHGNARRLFQLYERLRAAS